jgi:hypothetical protein
VAQHDGGRTKIAQHKKMDGWSNLFGWKKEKKKKKKKWGGGRKIKKQEGELLLPHKF